MNSEFWNDRYSSSDYAYGIEPNDFLKKQNFKPKGNILCLAEGEGRNAVFLARQGYKVTAIDYSLKGLQKTQQLAKIFKVSIDTICADIGTYDFDENQWDGIVCIFGHFPPSLRNKVHSKIYSSLKKGGKCVLVAYSKEQLKYNTGGPLNADLLYSINELEEDFSDFKTILIEQIEINISEGKFHDGLSSVIQIIGEK
ncbi:MAG: class I SAM-dependent methyltransferase [Bacteroidia bacterium]|nr:class I SAM-dependent methyltransferase [Bacteroidia bacterium]